MATQIYLGNPPPKIKEWIEKNYVKPEDPMLKVPLHFTANEDGSSVSLVCFDNYDIYDFIDSWCKLDYSMDGTTWNTYIDPDSSDEELHRGMVINLNKGETVYFRATLGDVEGNPNLNGFGYYDEDEANVTKYHYFVMEGSIKADGNIQFLLENTGTKMDVPDYCYYYMFQECTSLTRAPELPATTLASNCYAYMFEDCTSLTQAPELPAITLANWCYAQMFYSCTALTQAPELPAITLDNYCYQCMFKDCTSLTRAPELPAETLFNSCYTQMFDGCTSLTQAPALPATTLVDNCYNSMFSVCTSLTQAPALPAETLANRCYMSMFEGCTSLTQAPALPAETLANRCYMNMFYGCTSLTQAPALPATDLVSECYSNMFYGCNNLNDINVNFSAWNPTNATTNWVSSVSSSGTFTCPADLPETYGISNIPTDWTVVRK